MAATQQYYEKQERQTQWAMTNPAIDGPTLSYLKHRLVAVQCRLDAIRTAGLAPEPTPV